MPSITFTATRELQEGRTAGDTVTLAFNVTKFDWKFKQIGSRATSLSGVIEAIGYRDETAWLVETQPYDATEMNNWRELAASVAAGEFFLCDFTDVEGGRETTFFATMREGTFNEVRHAHYWFKSTFELVEV